MAGRRGDYLAILALALFWGLNWPSVRLALNDIGPWTLRALGMGAGASFLFVLATVKGYRLKMPKSQWLRVFAAGFFTITAFNLLLAFAQLMAPTSRAAIVTFTMPVWTVLFAYLVLGETLDRRRWLGMGFGLTGLVCLGWPLIQAGTFSYGLLLALGAGMSWALGSVIIKKWPADVPSMVITAWQLLAGAAVSAVGMVWFEPETLTEGLRVSSFPISTWLALFHHIVFSQAFAYLIWYSLLARLPAGTVSLAMLLVPAIGVIGSVLILGESPTLPDLAGLFFMTLAAGAVIAPSASVPASAAARAKP